MEASTLCVRLMIDFGADLGEKINDFGSLSEGFLGQFARCLDIFAHLGTP